MFARFTRLFGRTFAPPSERRTRSNLRVESLEDRTVPAALTWCPPGEDWTFDQADNWLIGNSPAGRIPAAGDSIVFDGAVTQLPCYGMHGASGGAYVAVSMSVDFPMATVSGDFTTDDLTLAGGAFSNTTTGIDLTVTDELTWTGGSLNSSWNEGTVNIAGNGTIDLTNGVSCGSALNFANPTVPATTTITGDGALDLPNGSPITIDAGYAVVVTAAPDATPKFTGPEGSYSNGKAKIELRENGSLSITGAGECDTGNRVFVNNGGHLEIKDGATARFGSSAILGPPQGTPLRPDIVQNTGIITIHSGCTITTRVAQSPVPGARWR